MMLRHLTSIKIRKKMKAVSSIIDTGALVRNMRQIRKMAPNSKLLAVVKANAYGHGLYPVAAALKDDADAFAVSRIEEALSLRTQGITKPIVLLEGFFNADDVDLVSRYDLYTAVHDLYQVRAIEQAKIQKPVHCWVQVDIGMHRLGSGSIEEITEIKRRLEASENTIKPLGLISHLSVADTPSEREYNSIQQDNFFYFAEKLKFSGDLSLGNSAGICKWPRSHTTWVRPGIIMYGISPFDDKCGGDLGLEPVMTLKASLIAVHHLKKGDKVGYGAGYVASSDTILGVLSAGYGDGYPRTAPNGTPVYLNGRYVPTAGHVCMDMMFVDLGPDSRDQIGDSAVLWGKEVPVETVASRCGTIPYELVCHIMPRVNIEYVAN